MRVANDALFSDVCRRVRAAAARARRRVDVSRCGADPAGSALIVRAVAMLTDDCCEFLLELLRFNLDEIESLWFFSDWSDAAPREFAQRVQDLCLSRLLAERDLADMRSAVRCCPGQQR